MNDVLMSIKLDHFVDEDDSKQLSLSNDGTFCIIGGGSEPYSFLIDLPDQKQHRLTSGWGRRTHSYSPCFINGDTELVAVGAWYSGVEVWNISAQNTR